MFENLSRTGVTFGAVGLIVMLALGKWTLNPFLAHMSGFGAVFWRIAIYLGAAVLGYFLGVRQENKA